MGRYFLHVFNRLGSVPDEEGVELGGLEVAVDLALDSIRSIISEEARQGRLDLDGRIEIGDSSGQVLRVVPFPEAFQLCEAGERAFGGSASR